MAIIEGTTGSDILAGTAEADTLTPHGTTIPGGRDVLRGFDGGDTYDLRRSAAVPIYNFLIDDRGTDGAVDTITNVGKLYQSASLGYVGYATAIRINDTLIFHAPSKPHRFRDAANPAYDIKIKDQYGDGHIETMQAGGVTYNLVSGSLGTASEDIMAGTNQADGFVADDGDDWMFGNGGRDTLEAGGGDDVVFGGNGGDTIRAGAGNDEVFGEAGHDRMWLGDGGDQARGGAGNDRIRGEAGGDWILGGDGDDRIFGGAGNDSLTGEAGDDLLVGGKEGDSYNFSFRQGEAGWGHDVMRDAGNAPSYRNIDTIKLGGFYGPSDDSSTDAFARVSFARDGMDMMIVADDGLASIRVEKMFDANQNRWFIETLELGAGYWEPLVFQILNGEVDAIGDDRDYVSGLYRGAANELLFGTAGKDLIYGDAGTNFIWTGGGADTLIYKANDNESWGGYGGGLSHDIVEDFNIARDRLDFSEIATVTSLAQLTIGQDAGGDATIAWNSGDYEVSSIRIELRGVLQAEVTADLFIFA